MPIIFFGTLSITPATGSVGDTITIDNTGAGFFDTMIVKFGGSGGTSADNIVVDSYGNGQQRITCDVPTGLDAGTYDIYIENPDGENGTIASAFEVVAVSAVSKQESLWVGVFAGAV